MCLEVAKVCASVVRAELGDGEIVPILGSVGPRADELIRIPATTPRTPRPAAHFGLVYRGQVRSESNSQRKTKIS